MIRIVALAIAACLLAGCGPTPPLDQSRMTNRIGRWEDPVYRVVCWELWGVAISCLPEPERRP